MCLDVSQCEGGGGISRRANANAKDLTHLVAIHGVLKLPQLDEGVANVAENAEAQLLGKEKRVGVPGCEGPTTR